MYYKTLFDINIHHGYFLDQGERKFLPVNPEDEADKLDVDEKESALNEYDFSSFLTVKPTLSTHKICKNYKIITRQHPQGFRVLVSTKDNQPIIPLEDDLTLTFELQLKDPYFYNYTNISSLLEKQLYLFTNVVPENQVDFENIFENENKPIDGDFLLNEEETRNLLKNIAGEDESFRSLSDQFSIIHAIQLIEEDESLENDQVEKDKRITDVLNQGILRKKQQKVIGYARLTIKGDTEDENLLTYQNDEQFMKESHSVFTISFINRKTFWRYKDRADDITLTTKTDKWLSKNGFVEITGKSSEDNPSDFDPEPVKDYVFPNPTIDIIKHEDNTNKDYSEIFI
jgi:hypothetical protein